MKFTIIFSCVAFVFGFFYGYQVGTPDDSVTNTDVPLQYIERPIAKADSASNMRPSVRKIYVEDNAEDGSQDAKKTKLSSQETEDRRKEIEAVDTVEVVKPKAYTKFNLASLTPLRRVDDRIVYTYFNPRDLRYEQEEYLIEHKKFSSGMFIGGGYLNERFRIHSLFISLNGYIRFKKFVFISSYDVVPIHKDGMLRLQLAYKLF